MQHHVQIRRTKDGIVVRIFLADTRLVERLFPNSSSDPVIFAPTRVEAELWLWRVLVDDFGYKRGGLVFDVKTSTIEGTIPN